MEIWKPTIIKGYSVSNQGRVRKDSTGEIVKQSNSNGYNRITITLNVHRLVAGAFLEKQEDERNWVDHIDGNRSNNNVENLRWVTPSENALSFGYNSRIKNKMKKIRATNLNGETIIFNSRRETAEYFKCSDSEIHYNRRFTRGNKKGWLLEKVEDIV